MDFWRKGDGVTVETIDSASVSSGVRSDMTSSGKPINDALVVVVLTVAAVFICVWLLNTNKLKCKTKWGIFCLMLVLFALVIFIITRIDDAYISKLPPPNDPELELAVKGAERAVSIANNRRNCTEKLGTEGFCTGKYNGN